MKVLKTILTGGIIGLANIIPGVSGGTLAVIMGVYDRLIGLTKKGALKKDWRFLLLLLIGMASSILLCSKVFAFLFENFQIAPSLVFFGMILGSLPMIFKLSLSYCPEEKGKKKLPAASIAAFVLSFAVMIGLTVLDLLGVSMEISAEPSFSLAVLLFFGGVLAAVSMVLPGISGSLMMVVIGVYTIVITMLSGLTDFAAVDYWQNVLLLIPFGIGVLIGLVLGLNAVRILLEKKPATMYFAILGLVAGSLLTVLPFEALHICTELWVGIALAAAAAFATFKMSKTEE
ncbi:MAG: DUF368 domain-containing protein [Firmicutes bacterium]|nr:DUF368 domain-containing protein [Bacillota bacterium]